MITHKTCSKCGIEKPVSEFGTASPNKDGYNSWCKQCVRDSTKHHRETASGVYSGLKGRQKFYHKNRPGCAKPFTITRGWFVDWYNSQEKVCVYCGLREEDIPKMDDANLQKVGRLTVDCKDNTLGYISDNIVLSCLRCNFTKNDFFSYEAWREIAQKYIKPVWDNKLKEISTKNKEEEK